MRYLMQNECRGLGIEITDVRDGRVHAFQRDDLSESGPQRMETVRHGEATYLMYVRRADRALARADR